ncbi:MAG TPA: hypothetical protein ENJ10_01530 [Caldithrix abyssi]|uniref:Uncharacterized protein n=1 Tax=Caldithrix abyssi TaxID=187145 RepID=A0A7V1PU06_CALAY|nr:hypothetical protein [Caldithrix abyssi]
MSPSNFGKILALLQCRDNKNIPSELMGDYKFVQDRMNILLKESPGSFPSRADLLHGETDSLSNEQIDYFISLFLIDHKGEGCLELATSLNDHFSWFSTYSTILRQFIQGCDAEEGISLKDQ